MSASHAGRACAHPASGFGAAPVAWRLSPQNRLMTCQDLFADAGIERASRGEMVR